MFTIYGDSNQYKLKNEISEYFVGSADNIICSDNVDEYFNVKQFNEWKQAVDWHTI